MHVLEQVSVMMILKEQKNELSYQVREITIAKKMNQL